MPGSLPACGSRSEMLSLNSISQDVWVTHIRARYQLQLWANGSRVPSTQIIKGESSPVLSHHLCKNEFLLHTILSLPGGSVVKDQPANAGDSASIPGSGSRPWRKNWQSTPEFLPGESMDRRVWWATGYEVAKDWNMTH